jgi:hypothetical protein
MAPPSRNKQVITGEKEGVGTVLPFGKPHYPFGTARRQSIIRTKTLDLMLPNGKAASKAVGRAELARFTTLRELAARVGHSAQISSP